MALPYTVHRDRRMDLEEYENDSVYQEEGEEEEDVNEEEEEDVNEEEEDDVDEEEEEEDVDEDGEDDVLASQYTQSSGFHLGEEEQQDNDHSSRYTETTPEDDEEDQDDGVQWLGSRPLLSSTQAPSEYPQATPSRQNHKRHSRHSTPQSAQQHRSLSPQRADAPDPNRPGDKDRTENNPIEQDLSWTLLFTRVWNGLTALFWKIANLIPYCLQATYVNRNKILIALFTVSIASLAILFASCSSLAGINLVFDLPLPARRYLLFPPKLLQCSSSREPTFRYNQTRVKNLADELQIIARNAATCFETAGQSKLHFLFGTQPWRCASVYEEYWEKRDATLDPSVLEAQDKHMLREQFMNCLNSVHLAYLDEVKHAQGQGFPWWPVMDTNHASKKVVTVEKVKVYTVRWETYQKTWWRSKTTGNIWITLPDCFAKAEKELEDWKLPYIEVVRDLKSW
ncbi:hypothetical protein BLS_002916 [Venturia inaequalis]|uniref:Uncharacterized protein n=1 Tax=Venturia inaequalis TaxID=5025 RepID=A0A8H3USX5_VENIN|nr:hypothetical protein EG328_004049 [Venturia inaequalis]KAE9974766.1 hypothetical protein BLS_002916 [Venturia inaequalis]